MHWNMLFIVPLAGAIVLFFTPSLNEFLELDAGPLTQGVSLVLIGYCGLRITPDLYPMAPWILFGPCFIIAGVATIICALRERLYPPAPPPTLADLLRQEAQAGTRPTRAGLKRASASP